MDVIGIKYIAPVLDNSGYAQAARGNILALYKAGIPTTVQPVSFETARPDLGVEGQILDSLISKPIDYNVVIIHTTPEFWHKHSESGKTNIGYTIWETDKLHPDWPKYINSEVDKVLVGCEWNKEVFENSGVTIPVGVVPHVVNTEALNVVKPYQLAGVPEDTYVFYSIYQWTERKHPISLIKSYWYAFQNDENVALVMKTYRSDYSDEEKNAIRISLKRLKQMTPMDRYPPIFLITDMLSNDEIVGLHKRGNCYVSTDRGEGFGLSPFMAGACGNPLIVTGFGGSTEYAKPDNSYLIDYQLTPCSGMPWCMSLKSLVKTTNGYIWAKDLEEGDVVENKNLTNKYINKVVFRKLLDSEEMYSLKHFSVPTSTELTSTHKLYVLDDNNIPVKRKVSEINVGDYLYVPKPNRHDELILDEEPYVDNITLDKQEDLFYLFGLYLAEGYIDKIKKYIGFSFNINEKHTLAFKCKECMYNLFPSEINSFYERDLLDRNGYEMIFYCNVSLLDLFEEKLGCGSHFKFITNEIKYSRYNHFLLKGYWDGDGHIRKEGYKSKKTGARRISPECVAETASFDLSMGIRDVLLSLGIVPSLYSSNRKDGRVSYIISVSDEGFDKLFDIQADRIKSRFKKKIDSGFGVLITKKELIEDYDDLICSISVDIDFDEALEDGGSYILNGIASSNSPWYRGDQLWAEPDVKHASDLMKHVYENQEEARGKGKLIQDYINQNFTYEVIGQKLIKEIENL